MTKASASSDRIRIVIEKAWADPAFKSKLLKDPHAALKTLGMDVPAGISVRVHENTASERHYVLPTPRSTDLSDAQLESVAGGRLNEKGQEPHKGG